MGINASCLKKIPLIPEPIASRNTCFISAKQISQYEQEERLTPTLEVNDQSCSVTSNSCLLHSRSRESRSVSDPGLERGFQQSGPFKGHLKHESLGSRGAVVEIEGYRHCERYDYHEGHMWVHQEDQALARIGLDHFAVSLIGFAEAVEMPSPTQKISQGMPVFSIKRDKYRISALSPIEGTISEINHALFTNPELIFENGFGDGWIAKVKLSQDSYPEASLVRGEPAKEWLMKECGFFRVLLSTGMGRRQNTRAARNEPGLLISDWAWVALVETFLRTRISLMF